MSISLYVHLADGKSIDLPLAGQSTATGMWMELANNLGLKHYDGDFPILIDPENIDEVMAELRLLAQADRPKSSGNEHRLPNVIAELEKVRLKTGWRATIG